MEIYRGKVQYTPEELFAIALQEYSKAGITVDDSEGIGQWAYYSSEQWYDDEDHVRRELRRLIEREQENKPAIEWEE